ncbi:putative mediator of RNA polymerase II transcription subunit [Clavispora lusitaniae]|uniref:Mediator of RNA polymerase II transcription subunit n=1 Tax=Clavispora lusitaniae TaxID=36911 RepID=A0ACD0WKN7_CLALS|nr:RNA polymerase II mediator complex subunit [Clavispora lusitaniae]QFZ28124.1 putative mediator of RNA polymerase II transcription subunit [Clavispora lusitaniae]QFZ33787.1 putative mediator of RNA polymerase II transcription subunit [Clavispora lusitaniae]QFZ39471.1 putative mediator of RNA polymerase II transcription subunit [Clavispora lusitaniae]QFZ45153.1 putative mediator of RNA polymerase II transcription subunit [Clavispora lusitaniae]
MADRLTQLQVCLDQLVAQFNATVNYVNTHSEMAPLDPDPHSVINLAANAPPPGKKDDTSGANSAPSNDVKTEAPFESVLNELSTDIILKSRQISMIIDSLPGIGTLPETQLKTITELIEELEKTEKERRDKIKEKDELLRWCEELIFNVSGGIYRTRS